MKNYSLVILVAFSLALIATIFKNKYSYNEKLEAINGQLANMKYQSKKTQALFIEHLDLEKNEINFDRVNLSFLKNGIRIKEKTIVLRFFKENCRECIDKIFKAVNKYENIVIITNYDNQRELNLLIKELKITYPVVIMDRLFENEPSMFPYMFVIEKSKVDNLYVPNEDLPELTERYVKFFN